MLRISDCVPGTMVECIDDSARNSFGKPNLVCGAVYSITGLFEDLELPGVFGIRVEGARLKRGSSGFHLYRFRLVPDERLAVFRAMLRPVNDPATARRATASGQNRIAGHHRAFGG